MMMIYFKAYFIGSLAALVHLTTCIELDRRRVTGTSGKTISLQWEFSNTNYEYFNLKKGDVKIAEYSTGNKQTFLKEYGKNRITVSWKNTIFSLDIRNLTEEDKGAYTSKAVYNNELITSIIILDISEPTRFTEALVKPATHILHANVGDDIEIKWKQVGNYENATDTSLGVDIFLDDKKTNSKNWNSTEKTVFIPLRKMKEKKTCRGIELNFNENNYIMKLYNLTFEDSIHIRFVVRIGNKTESYTAQLKVHGADAKQLTTTNYETAQEADDDSSLVKWKTFACVCITIIVIIILGVLVTLILIRTGRLNLKFCGIRMTKMSTKQFDKTSNTEASKNQQEANIKPTNNAIQINEMGDEEEEENVEPTIPLIVHQTTSPTTKIPTSSPTTNTSPTTTEMPPHPKKYPLNLLPETSLQTNELDMECGQDVSDAGGEC